MIWRSEEEELFFVYQMSLVVSTGGTQRKEYKQLRKGARYYAKEVHGDCTPDTNDQLSPSPHPFQMGIKYNTFEEANY